MKDMLSIQNRNTELETLLKSKESEYSLKMAEFEKTQNELNLKMTDIQNQLTEKLSVISKMELSLKEKEDKILELEKNNKTVEEKAQLLAAAQGVPVQELVTNNNETVLSDSQMLEKLNTLSGAERTKFYNENRMAILRATGLVK